MTFDVVEPTLLLPNEAPCPIAVRSFGFDGEVIKIVIDDVLTGNNAIFVGAVLVQGDNSYIKGELKYDDTDQTSPLTLKWIADIHAKEGKRDHSALLFCI